MSTSLDWVGSLFSTFTNFGEGVGGAIVTVVFVGVEVLTTTLTLEEEPSSFFYFLKEVAANAFMALASKSLTAKERRKKGNELRFDEKK